MAFFQQKKITHLFYRQASLGDAALLGPLPPGWEETHTQEGQKYYMNHITKSTQWEDPRITVSQLPLHQNNQHVAQISGGPGGSLPHGWEQGTTPEGEIYYIDHSTHRTQWHDPRIPQSQQPNIPQRINNQGTSQQRLLQLQREKKAVLVRFLSIYVYRQSRLFFQSEFFKNFLVICFCWQEMLMFVNRSNNQNFMGSNLHFTTKA